MTANSSGDFSAHFVAPFGLKGSQTLTAAGEQSHSRSPRVSRGSTGRETEPGNGDPYESNLRSEHAAGAAVPHQDAEAVARGDRPGREQLEQGQPPGPCP